MLLINSTYIAGENRGIKIKVNKCSHISLVNMKIIMLQLINNEYIYIRIHWNYFCFQFKYVQNLLVVVFQQFIKTQEMKYVTFYF